MDNLKLIAFNSEDLAVVSAHLQDAVLTVGDLVYQPPAKRFVALLSRFDWSSALENEGAAERCQCALRFERVLAARHAGIDLARTADPLALLALQFDAKGPDDPGGTVLLLFAGGGAIQLDVECLELELKDLGPRWRAKSKPSHPVT